MKKIIILLIITTLVFIGCGKKQTKTDRTEVIFWHAMGGPLGAALKGLVEDFNETHPEIHINAINMGNYTALSQKLMASIQTGDQPNIAQAFEAWTANMIEGDVIMPLDNFIADDPEFGEEDLNDVFQVFRKSNTINGKFMSFPFNKSVQVLYYNKDMFYQNGLDPNKPPKTWEEFRKVCKILTQDTDDDGKIDQYGATLKISAWYFENLLLQAGGEILSEDNEPLFNSEEGVKALELITTLLNKDKSAYLSPGYEGQNDFLASKVGIYIDSSVSYAYMQRTGINFNVGIAALPVDKTRRNIISGTNVAIFKHDDEKVMKAAWEFVKWFTDTKQTAEWSEKTYYMPVRKSALEVEALKQRLENKPEIQDVYDQLKYATFEPQISEWFEIRKFIEEHAIERVIRGIYEPEEALDKAAKELKKKLNETEKKEMKKSKE